MNWYNWIMSDKHGRRLITCTNCLRDNVVHVARGLCGPCYQSVGQPRITCSECGRENMRNAGHSLCHACKRRLNMTPEKAEKAREANIRWHTENREAYLARRRRRYAEGRLNHRLYLLKRYGLTEDSYAELLIKQGGVCAICGGGPDRRSPNLCVDHDHATGRVRGLLCNACNLGVGMYETRKDAMLAYLAE